VHGFAQQEGKTEGEGVPGGARRRRRDRRRPEHLAQAAATAAQASPRERERARAGVANWRWKKKRQVACRAGPRDCVISRSVSPCPLFLRLLMKKIIL
jgi:hypothetical protein